MKLILYQEIIEHNTTGGKWIIAHGLVYDVATFLNRHPGGTYVIKSNIGKDVSRYFDFHSRHAKKIWKRYCIGKLSTKPSGKYCKKCIIS